MSLLSPRGARRLIVFPAGLTVAFCLNLVNLGLVFFLREERQATTSQIGIYTAIAWLAYCVGCQVMPPRFATRSAVRVVMGSLCGLSLCMLLIQYVHPMPTLYVIAGVQGLCLSLFWPVVMSWATHKLESEALNRAMGWFNLSWSTGMILGPFAAGLLCDIASILAIAAAAVLFCLLAGWIVIVVALQPQVCEQQAGGKRSKDSGDEPDSSTPLRFPCWLGLAATFVGVGVLMTVFPLVADEQMGIARPFIGMLFLLRSLLMTLAFLGLARVSFWHHRGWPLVVSMVVMGGLHVFLLAVNGEMGLIILFCLIGLFGAFNYNMSLFHGAAGSPDRTSRMAIHESLIGGGIVIDSFAGGWLCEHVSAEMVFYATGAMFWGVAILQGGMLLLQRRGRAVKRDTLAA